MVTEEKYNQVAAVALQFLQRAQMSGVDADNYIVVRNWLTMIANGNLVVSAPPKPADTKVLQAAPQPEPDEPTS